MPRSPPRAAIISAVAPRGSVTLSGAPRTVSCLTSASLPSVAAWISLVPSASAGASSAATADWPRATASWRAVTPPLSAATLTPRPSNRRTTSGNPFSAASIRAVVPSAARRSGAAPRSSSPRTSAT